MTSQLVQAETTDPFTAAREDYIDGFRIHGFLDSAKASQLEKRIQAFIASSPEKSQGQAFFELGTIQRIGNRWQEAIRSFEKAAALAESSGNRELSFNARIGIARSHAYGTMDHGAAAAAFEMAVAAAGTNPTTKQRYDMAGYSSQLQEGRGDLEAALVNGLKAVHIAREMAAQAPDKKADLFYAQLDLAGILLKFAESCDYRKIQDAKSFDPGDDAWGGCRRSVSAADAYYREAKETAKGLGWNHLAAQVDQFRSNLNMRLQLISQKASFEKLGLANLFEAKDVRDVLINEDFSAGGASLESNRLLAAAIDHVAPEAGAESARNRFLRGIKADLDKLPQAALAHYQGAVALLRAERASYFDPRQRGTLVENRIELVTNLALRLLALGKPDEAFVAFESVRAQGLAELATVNTDSDFSPAERHALSDVVFLESRAGALASRMVELTIAGMEKGLVEKKADELEALDRQRQNLLIHPAFLKASGKFSAKTKALPSIREFQSSLRKTNHDAVIYWVTHTNVVVWVITPDSLLVKTIFLPEVALVPKIDRVLASIKSDTKPFDEESARQLHTYLIKPFIKHFRGKLLIIPQGPLVQLPFEVLVDSESGKFLAEEMTISYAPNVRFAMRALEKPIPRLSKVGAVYDEGIDRQTQEVSRLAKLKSLSLVSEKSKSKQAVLKALGAHEISHALLHGEHNGDDPLLSELQLRNARNETITAAELLSVDWSRTHLAVFSSCQGALVKSRISNEVVGLPWALLAGGIGHVVLSRWEVDKASNADWMEAFYRELGTGSATPAQSAAAAMRKLIKDGRRHPYFWAGPQAFGK